MKHLFTDLRIYEIRKTKNFSNMKTKFLIFIITGLLFAGGLLLCSNIKTGEIKFETQSEQTEELKISKSFNITPGILMIEASIADVILKSHEENNVKVDFYARGSAEQLKNFDLSFEEGNGFFKIKIKHKKEFKWYNFFKLFDFIEGSKIETAQLVVYAPEFLNGDIKTAGADIKVEKFIGTFTLSSSGGDIYCEGIDGTINASSAGGDIRFKNCSGTGTARTSGGDVFVSNHSGIIEAKSAGGDVRINKISGSVVASSSGGDIEVEFIKIEMQTNLTSSGGDIKIFAPSDLNAYVDFETFGGDINFDFPIKTEMKTSSKIKGWIGKEDSGVKIKATTSGGDIELRKRDKGI